jgi:hypothetical protein
MAYDNLKLEKGLYSTSKGFTQSLEEIDPSENYIGTELEGLDAYQRQLKRFDIKVSGIGSDTVSKFFATTDSAALFPEYVSRAVRQGIEADDILDGMIATTTMIDSLDYRAIESAPTDEEKLLTNVNEGTYIPETVIRTKENLTKLHKRGRMLVASYEAIKFQKLDVFTVTLKQIGACIAKSQVNDAISSLVCNDTQVINLEADPTYSDLVNFWAQFYPYNLTTLIMTGTQLSILLNMDEFKDSNAGLNFHGTGNIITPFGAQVLRYEALESDSAIIGLDKNYALEKVQAGEIMTDYDKLIDRQLERATITTIAGFSPIFTDACKVLIQ